MWQSGLMWLSGRARSHRLTRRCSMHELTPAVTFQQCHANIRIGFAGQIDCRSGPWPDFALKPDVAFSRSGHDLAKCSRVSLQRNWIANLSDVACDFLRICGDCNAYIRGEQAGRRIMTSLIRFIEGTSNAGAMRIRSGRRPAWTGPAGMAPSGSSDGRSPLNRLPRRAAECFGVSQLSASGSLGGRTSATPGLSALPPERRQQFP